MKLLINFSAQFFAAALLLFIAAAPPRAQPTAPPHSPGDSKTTIECRDSDMECFIRAAEKCQQATLTNYASRAFFDQEFSQTTFYEIKGSKGSRCEFYFKLLDWQVKPVELPEAEKEKLIRQMNGGASAREMTEEEKKRWAEREQIMKKRMSDAIGRNGTCTYRAANLAAVLKRWNSNNFSTEDYKGANCRGTYFTPENGFYNYEK